MMLPKAQLPTPSAHRAILALMLREMAATYGRSPGGWIWAVAEPIAAVALLAFVFQLAFDAPPLGQSFVLFYATGYLPFMLFTDVSLKTANALRFSRQLLGYPAITPLDALIARFVLNLMTQIIVIVLVVLGVEIIFDTGALYAGPVLLAALGLAALLAAGVGCLNCALFHRFPVWERLWQIITRPLFLVSGIFFLIEDVPQEYRDIALHNPLLHLTALVRRGVYAPYDADLANPVFVAGVGLSCLVLGLLALRLSGKEPVYA
ncbi:MAG: ABC transporter permease [Pseudomonadota bacterium]